MISTDVENSSEKKRKTKGSTYEKVCYVYQYSSRYI